MEFDVERVAGWIDSLVKRPEDIADLFVETRRSVVTELSDGEVVAVRAQDEEGLSARLASAGRESLAFVSSASESGAREAVRSLQRALGRPPLPVKPDRGDENEEPGDLEVERWNKRLPALLARIAPRHRLRWSLTETARRVIPARAPAAASLRRLFSIEGTLIAASRRGDEVRAFNFHAPDAESTGEEVRAALHRAQQPRDAPAPCGDGETAVVLAGGCAALFFHEILSHPLEAGQESPLSGLEQARVSVPELDVRDDPLRLDLFGGYERDDEGTRPRGVKLLDGGRVAGRLTDRAHGARPPSNGHARRAGPGDLPLPRGANVVVASGHATTDEMARRLSSGLWIEELDGGSIELASGRFRLKFPRARRVRRGRLADECGPGLLAGDILSALKAIDGGLGRDVHVYRALGFCARSGQIVPVQGAAPDVLVRRLAVRSLT
ncbi:MAG TPA: metallopeptidase TldD-related protein [Thermoanaerobaculia bacterium]|nr:metallopeptidase TldD-related protein [Thermoanaerobaculia bacterium]